MLSGVRVSVLGLLGRLRCSPKPPKTQTADCEKQGKRGTADMNTASDHEVGKQILDVLSVATVIGALVDILPSIAALFTIVWTGLRIFESETVQNLLRKKK